MTFSSPQIIRAKAEASLEQAQTAFWFPVLPGLQALPSTPTITTNPDPAPANAVAVPAGFNFDNPDLADLFKNILPKGVAPVFPRTMGPAAGLIVPPFNEIQRWEARIRVPAEATLLPFSNEIVHLAAATLKVRIPSVKSDSLLVASGAGAGSGKVIAQQVRLPVAKGNGAGNGKTVGLYEYISLYIVASSGAGSGSGKVVVQRITLPITAGAGSGVGVATIDRIRLPLTRGNGTGIGRSAGMGQATLDALPGAGSGVGQPVTLTVQGVTLLALAGAGAGAGNAINAQVRMPVAAGAGSGVGQPVTLTAPSGDPAATYWESLNEQQYAWFRDFYPDWWAD